jgi:hypothetical protein
VRGKKRKRERKGIKEDIKIQREKKRAANGDTERTMSTGARHHDTVLVSITMSTMNSIKKERKGKGERRRRRDKGKKRERNSKKRKNARERTR